jgi:hypothetical protein
MGKLQILQILFWLVPANAPGGVAIALIVVVRVAVVQVGVPRVIRVVRFLGARPEVAGYFR